VNINNNRCLRLDCRRIWIQGDEKKDAAFRLPRTVIHFHCSS